MDENGNLLDYPAKKAIDPEAEFIAATNLFGYMSDYMERETTPLTRSNWDATVPVDTSESGNVGTPGTTKVPLMRRLPCSGTTVITMLWKITTP